MIQGSIYPLWPFPRKSFKPSAWKWKAELCTERLLKGLKGTDDISTTNQIEGSGQRQILLEELLELSK